MWNSSQASLGLEEPRLGFLYLLPPLTYRVPLVCANNSKFQEESTIQHRTTFTLQDTANAPPQMPLDNPEFTSSMSSLLEKASQNGLYTHIPQEVTQNGYSSGNSLQMSQYPVGSTALNRSGTLQECNNLPQKNSAPHWAPIVTHGRFLGE